MDGEATRFRVASLFASLWRYTRLGRLSVSGLVTSIAELDLSIALGPEMHREDRFFVAGEVRP